MERSMAFEQALYVTGRTPQLQGLRLIPIGLVCLAACPYSLGLYHLPGDDQPLARGYWFLIGLLVAMAASYPLRGLYKESWTTPRLRRSPVLAMVATVAAMSLAGWFQPSGWPISLPIVVLALALAIVGLRKYPLRRHYLWASAVCVAWALLKPLGVARDVRGALFYAAIGVAIIIIGVGDHFLLVTTNVRIPEDV